MRSLFCLALGPAKWWREQCLLRGMSWHDKLLPRRMLNASVDHLSCPALPWRSLGIFLSRSRGRSNEPINQSINLCFPWDFRVVFGRIKERMKTSINQSINQSIHPSIHPSIYPSIHQNQSINQSINQYLVCVTLGIPVSCLGTVSSTLALGEGVQAAAPARVHGIQRRALWRTADPVLHVVPP